MTTTDVEVVERSLRDRGWAAAAHPAGHCTPAAILKIAARRRSRLPRLLRRPVEHRRDAAQGRRRRRHLRAFFVGANKLFNLAYSAGRRSARSPASSSASSRSSCSTATGCCASSRPGRGCGRSSAALRRRRDVPALRHLAIGSPRLPLAVARIRRFGVLLALGVDDALPPGARLGQGADLHRHRRRRSGAVAVRAHATSTPRVSAHRRCDPGSGARRRRDLPARRRLGRRRRRGGQRRRGDRRHGHPTRRHRCSSRHRSRRRRRNAARDRAAVTGVDLPHSGAGVHRRCGLLIPLVRTVSSRSRTATARKASASTTTAT